MLERNLGLPELPLLHPVSRPLECHKDIKTPYAELGVVFRLRHVYVFPYAETEVACLVKTLLIKCVVLGLQRIPEEFLCLLLPYCDFCAYCKAKPQPPCRLPDFADCFHGLCACYFFHYGYGSFEFLIGLAHSHVDRNFLYL